MPRLYNKSRRKAQVKRSDFLQLSAWKQHFLRNVGSGQDSYACLSRELCANSHKYPGITQSDLALAWEHNRGTPAPTGRDAEKGGLADWLRSEGYARRPGNRPGEFVWSKA
jgi:hypothetical protein